MTCDCNGRFSVLLSFLQDIKAELGLVKGKCYTIEKELFGISSDNADASLVAVMETTTVRQIVEKLAFDLEWLKREREEVKKEEEKVQARAEELKRKEEEAKRRSEEETKRLEENRRIAEAEEVKKTEEELLEKNTRRTNEELRRGQEEEDGKSWATANKSELKKLGQPPILKLLKPEGNPDLERKIESNPAGLLSDHNPFSVPKGTLQSKPRPGRQSLYRQQVQEPVLKPTREPLKGPLLLSHYASVPTNIDVSRVGFQNQLPPPQNPTAGFPSYEKGSSSLVNFIVCHNCTGFDPRNQVICGECKALRFLQRN